MFTIHEKPEDDPIESLLKTESRVQTVVVFFKKKARNLILISHVKI